ncbi:unnamed protein product [Caenorhabditis nigoni]
MEDEESRKHREEDYLGLDGTSEESRQKYRESPGRRQMKPSGQGKGANGGFQIFIGYRASGFARDQLERRRWRVDWKLVWNDSVDGCSTDVASEPKIGSPEDCSGAEKAGRLETKMAASDWMDGSRFGGTIDIEWIGSWWIEEDQRLEQMVDSDVGEKDVEDGAIWMDRSQATIIKPLEDNYCLKNLSIDLLIIRSKDKITGLKPVRPMPYFATSTVSSRMMRDDRCRCEETPPLPDLFEGYDFAVSRSSHAAANVFKSTSSFSEVSSSCSIVKCL